MFFVMYVKINHFRYIGLTELNRNRISNIHPCQTGIRHSKSCYCGRMCNRQNFQVFLNCTVNFRRNFVVWLYLAKGKKLLL